MAIRGKSDPRAEATAGEALVIETLTFIAGDGERLGRFLAITGLGPGDLRAAAGAPEFQRSLIDYLLSDEELIKALASSLGRSPEAVAAVARRASPPGPWD
ncbi:MAG: DUF3572 domain-containing protein [Hyphomicrobiales bacterium]|nr:DUF3572 family protein [Hyphomicrobiales bacterium]MDE2017737.1 DUF3572 domain-containing protein [Hyphomicrobiales bacterium]